MQSLLQLNPPIPLLTPKGEGMAVMVIDYGPDFDLWWTVIISKGEKAGEIWTYPNPQVRGVQNITLGRDVDHGEHPLPLSRQKQQKLSTAARDVQAGGKKRSPQPVSAAGSNAGGVATPSSNGNGHSHSRPGMPTNTPGKTAKWG